MNNNNKQFDKNNNSDVCYFVKSYTNLTKKLRDKSLENKSLNSYLSEVEQLLNKVSVLKSPQKEEEFVRSCLMLDNRELNIIKIAA